MYILIFESDNGKKVFVSETLQGAEKRAEELFLEEFCFEADYNEIRRLETEKDFFDYNGQFSVDIYECVLEGDAHLI